MNINIKNCNIPDEPINFSMEYKNINKVYFKDNELKVDIRMDWGKYKDWNLPARWETSYFIDKRNNG